MLAARVCESLREAGLPRGSVANYDLAVAFLARHAAELGRSKKRETAIRVVYHGTQSKVERIHFLYSLHVPDRIRTPRSASRPCMIITSLCVITSQCVPAILEEGLRLPNGEDVKHSTNLARRHGMKYKV